MGKESKASARKPTGKGTNSKRRSGTSRKPKGQLIIVESPTKIKTLRKFLGNSFTVVATKGHIIDLPKSKLGVEIEEDFKPQYKVIHGKGPIIKELVREAKKHATIYLAPDPDREGEAIAYHLLTRFDKVKGEVKRVRFNEITKKAVEQGLADADKIDMRKVFAQQARRILDRLVGYQVSPILWQTILRGLSAGRVQSVALRVICEREEEIAKFEPKEYWSISTVFGSDGSSFEADLFKIDGADVEIGSSEEAEKIVDEIRPNTFTVKAISRETRSRNPQPPYITSTLQQDVARQIGFSTQKTMIVAQQLYEGIDLGDRGAVGLITYMRTDSVRTAEEALTSLREHIGDRFGSEYLPSEPREFKSRKRSQDAHEAIRPTDLTLEPSSIREYLSTEQYKVYNLIYRRFVASQMTPAQYDQLKVDLEGGKYLFRAVDTRLKFDGYLKVYEEAGDDSADQSEKEREIPDLEENQEIAAGEVIPDQHFTKPPARYSEASLVKELERNGIGRPSTYAQIINTLKSRRYVELDKKRLIPTELGTTVNGILVSHFNDIFNVEFTAGMEDDLDRIEEGNDEWVDVLHEFYEKFSVSLSEVEDKIDEIKAETMRESDELCDKCGSSMIVKWGRNGQFLACSAYPECENTRPLNNEDNGKPVERDCPKCGEPLIYRQGRFGKFIACSAYPDCKYTESISVGIKCPAENCSGDLVQRRTRRGKLFFGCSEYPNCRFAVWYQPVARECPACGFAVMVEKETKRLGRHLACPNCKNTISSAEKETVAEYQNAYQ